MLTLKDEALNKDVLTHAIDTLNTEDIIPGIVTIPPYQLASSPCFVFQLLDLDKVILIFLIFVLYLAVSAGSEVSCQGCFPPLSPPLLIVDPPLQLCLLRNSIHLQLTCPILVSIVRLSPAAVAPCVGGRLVQLFNSFARLLLCFFSWLFHDGVLVDLFLFFDFVDPFPAFAICCDDTMVYHESYLIRQFIRFVLDPQQP